MYFPYLNSHSLRNFDLKILPDGEIWFEIYILTLLLCVFFLCFFKIVVVFGACLALAAAYPYPQEMPEDGVEDGSPYEEGPQGELETATVLCSVTRATLRVQTRNLVGRID
jgi:hypothetical protein